MLGQVPFVHPAMAAAALAAGALPILIHLLNRRRFRRVPFAAMRFLLAASRRSAKRVRLEHFLLMAARVTLIVLFGLAVARPFVPASGWVPIEATGVHRVLLLDNSLSMSARRPDGKTRFAAAKECAFELLNGFPASDPVSLITLASPAERSIGQGSLDRRLAKDALAVVDATRRSTDLTGGLTAAIDILKQSKTATGNRAVYILSDFPRNLLLPGGETPGSSANSAELAAQRLSPLPPHSPLPTTHSPLQGEAADGLRRLQKELSSPNDLVLLYADRLDSPNAGITDLRADSPAFARDIPVRLSAVVTNFGDAPLRAATVLFHVGGRPIRREPLPLLEPGKSATVFASILLAESGSHGIEATLVAERGNSLAEDDARYLSLDVRNATRVLLVDGRPGTRPLEGECGFVTAALAPDLVAEAGGPPSARPPDGAISVKSASAREIATEPLASYDAIAVCNVPRLTSEEWALLADFVRGGGGLFVSLGDAVNLDNYNRLGAIVNNGPLPGTLEAGPASAAAVPDKEPVMGLSQGADPAAGDFTIRADDLDHPIAAQFRDQATSGLFLARTKQYVHLAPDPGAQVVLRFSSGDPALVAAETGRGRVLLLTTSADMDWTNLPAKGDFVSLMLSALSYLTSGRASSREITVGQPIHEPLTAAQTSMEIRATGLDGANLETTFSPVEGGLALSTAPIDFAGLVSVAIGQSLRRFAANVDTGESDLAAANPDALSAALGNPFRFVPCNPGTPALAELHAGSAASTELGSLGLYLVTLLLLAELWLGMQFSVSHGAQKAELRTGFGRERVAQPDEAGGRT